MTDKDDSLKGPGRGRGRYTPIEVIDLRRRWRAGEKCARLAKEKGVTWASMDDVLKGRTYVWVRQQLAEEPKTARRRSGRMLPERGIWGKRGRA